MVSRAGALAPATGMQAAPRRIHRPHLIETSLLPHAGLVPERLAARYRHLPSFHHTLHLISLCDAGAGSAGATLCHGWCFQHLSAPEFSAPPPFRPLRLSALTITPHQRPGTSVTRSFHPAARQTLFAKYPTTSPLLRRGQPDHLRRNSDSPAGAGGSYCLAAVPPI